MARELILDSGALISLLDRRQQLHGPCREFFEGWTGPVVTTEAVLTESTHLLGRVHGGRRACLDFILSGGAILVPTGPQALKRCRQLVAAYEDLPMDFADATLVALAEELDSDLIFTTDRRDFSLYRLPGDRPFRLFPRPE